MNDSGKAKKLSAEYNQILAEKKLYVGFCQATKELMYCQIVKPDIACFLNIDEQEREKE